MPIDRAATLQNAEKLVRQGRAADAAREYARVLDDYPTDWNTANLLGDLYVRAGQVEQAVAQFVRIADAHRAAGFLPKAAAVYKKVIKLVPGHEHALLQLADIAAGQGLLADARSHWRTVAGLRRAAGDRRGEGEIAILLASVDRGDIGVRMAGARARIDAGDVGGALAEWKDLATELLDEHREADALKVLDDAVATGAADAEIRLRWLGLLAGCGAFERACASADPEEIRAAASRLEHDGKPDAALTLLKEAARLLPSDAALRAHVARTLAARGDIAGAADYVAEDVAGGDPRLLLILAEARLNGGQVDAGLTAVRRLVSMGRDRWPEVATLGKNLARLSPDTGAAVVGLVVDAAIAVRDWHGAMSTLQEFIARSHGHVPSLMRLVDVSIDAGDESAAYAAQGQLADAYLAAGAAVEARVIAEDLVAREPWDRANIERYRQALLLQGERDPDAIIADRLSGASPFLSVGARQADAAIGETPAPRRAETIEVDLSIELDSPGSTDPAMNLESVFAALREDPALKTRQDLKAESMYRGALALLDAGEVGEAVTALESAARSPRVRFAAASRAARLHRERGDARKAVEWFERAVETPPPTPEDGLVAMYELADALESTGEPARALAVCMELYAEAGGFRDISERLDRLARAQPGGAL